MDGKILSVNCNKLCRKHLGRQLSFSFFNLLYTFLNPNRLLHACPEKKKSEKKNGPQRSRIHAQQPTKVAAERYTQQRCKGVLQVTALYY